MVKSMDTDEQIDRLTRQLDSDLSAWVVARRASAVNEVWKGYAADQASVSRKLMAVDETLMRLSALIPDEMIGGDVEAPQEYAPAILAILKAENTLLNGGLQ